MLFWFYFHFGMEPHVERVQDFDRSFQRYTEIFVAFVAGNLRLVYFKSSSEISLRDSLSYSESYQQMTKSP